MGIPAIVSGKSEYRAIFGAEVKRVERYIGRRRHIVEELVRMIRRTSSADTEFSEDSGCCIVTSCEDLILCEILLGELASLLKLRPVIA